ncbi:hypothetical protein RvY_05769 [Ramazzottius varieornatus]|uniref:Deoxyuridine 5'-triphosphate nucleotidohydrolase n=1 Tax=Ramazzottius varieornatus TaxID=947166 RepID=A0A1D1UW62_RAMVA|nr:hypothetical protein RvY_05769 [Ramazzottius varieornatus]
MISRLRTLAIFAPRFSSRTQLLSLAGVVWTHFGPDILLRMACTGPASAVLRFKKLTDKAHAPSKGSPLAAGHDLRSAYSYEIPPHDKCVVQTDIQVAVPEGTYGRVAPRSGLAAKNFIDVGAGVIDADYRGNVGIVLFNFGKDVFIVNPGDRVAQLICEKIVMPDLQESKENLDETQRGEGGFGSTGIN